TPALRACSLAAMLCLTLVACTTIKVDMPADMATPKAFDHAPTASSPEAASSGDIANWWHTIPDPTLIQLIDQGLAANPDIRAAVARVLEARTVVTTAESALYPTLMAYGATG
ncbi:hypothetical protein KZW06_30235, partial [Klebsiella pneumoniae]|nr:hypothetical protein [Klebsiella pneumoniae]